MCGVAPTGPTLGVVVQRRELAANVAVLAPSQEQKEAGHARPNSYNRDRDRSGDAQAAVFPLAVVPGTAARVAAVRGGAVVVGLGEGCDLILFFRDTGQSWVPGELQGCQVIHTGALGPFTVRAPGAVRARGGRRKAAEIDEPTRYLIVHQVEVFHCGRVHPEAGGKRWADLVSVRQQLDHVCEAFKCGRVDLRE